MSKLLIHEAPLQVLPTLAVKIGLNEAIILQQLHYWLSRSGAKIIDGKPWVYNTYQDWLKQFPFWSDKTLRRTLGALEEINLVESANHSPQKFDRTKWYTINYNQLEQLELGSDRIGQNDHMERSDCPLDHLVKMTKSNKKEQKITKNSLSLEGEGEKMLLVWNKIFSETNIQTEMTEQRLKKLNQVLKNQFRDSLEEWEEYCKRLTTSQFLMGEKTSTWKVTLDWAVIPQNIQKVKEGAYGIGDRVPSQLMPLEVNEVTRLEDCLEGIYEDSLSSETFKKLQEAILYKVGPASYQNWFKKLKEEDFKDSVLTLKAPSLWAADRLQDRFSDILIQMARFYYGEDVQVKIKG